MGFRGRGVSAATRIAQAAGDGPLEPQEKLTVRGCTLCSALAAVGALADFPQCLLAAAGTVAAAPKGLPLDKYGGGGAGPLAAALKGEPGAMEVKQAESSIRKTQRAANAPRLQHGRALIAQQLDAIAQQKSVLAQQHADIEKNRAALAPAVRIQGQLLSPAELSQRIQGQLNLMVQYRAGPWKNWEAHWGRVAQEETERFAQVAAQLRAGSSKKQRTSASPSNLAAATRQRAVDDARTQTVKNGLLMSSLLAARADGHYAGKLSGGAGAGAGSSDEYDPEMAEDDARAEIRAGAGAGARAE